MCDAKQIKGATRQQREFVELSILPSAKVGVMQMETVKLAGATILHCPNKSI